MEDISRLKEKAKNAEAENSKFFAKLKRSVPRDLDGSVQDLHQLVFEETDCLSCANCCKTTSPIFRDGDIERIAKRLKMRPSAFIEKYLHLDEDRDYVLNDAPCVFLDPENRCTIYSDRPAACREYPHTNRKRFHQVFDLTLKNAEICPAVFRIIEELKTIY